jgi:Galactose oxidase, central domain
MKRTSRILRGAGWLCRDRGRGRAYLLAVAAGLLAAVGVPGVAQSAAVTGSSSGLTWTKQHPAAHPSARSGAAVAYDAATGTVVLFGGAGSQGVLGDTWVWDGSTWAKQHPAASPPARSDTAMAYDAATGTVVLFGGFKPASPALGSTWIWGSS